MAFPEITICPSFKSHTHNWKALCDVYGMCNPEEFKEGMVFPSNIPSSDITLSEFYEKITYNLDNLISRLTILTREKSAVTNTRCVYIFNCI